MYSSAYALLYGAGEAALELWDTNAGASGGWRDLQKDKHETLSSIFKAIAFDYFQFLQFESGKGKEGEPQEIWAFRY